MSFIRGGSRIFFCGGGGGGGRGAHFKFELTSKSFPEE